MEVPFNETTTTTQNETETKGYTTEVEEVKLIELLDEIQEDINVLTKNIRDVSMKLRTYKKNNTKLLKILKKKQRKSHKEGHVKRNPSGFASPVKISDELAEFIGAEKGQLFPRMVVTKHIVNYVRTYNLGNGRKFDLTDTQDENAVRLKNLLGVEKGDEVGYFNLQTYLKKHFTTVKNSDTSEPPVEEFSSDETKTEDKKKKVKRKKVKN